MSAQTSVAGGTDAAREAPALFRILVVDDEEPMCRLVAGMLKQSVNAQILMAGSGREAQELIDEQPFDLVISDLQMPDELGTDLLRRVKVDHPETEFVILTGHGSLDSALEAVKGDAYDYLLKPVKRGKLVAVVRNALAKSALHRENEFVHKQLLRFNEELQLRVDHKTTELAKRVRQLEVATAKATALMECLPLGCVILDAKGRVDGLNERARRYLGAVAPGDAPPFEGLLEQVRTLAQEAATTGGERHFEARGDGGVTRSYVLRSSRVPIEDSPDLHVILIEDVSDKELLQREVRKKQNLAVVGGLASGIAHEIKNPLGAIRGLGELLSINVDKMASLKKYAETIMSEVDRLTRIVNGVSTFSKIVEFSFEEADLDEALQAAVTAAAPDETIEVILDLAGDLPAVRVDKSYFDQALGHIVRNALEAMPEGGRLSLSSRRIEDTLLLQVADTGVGLPQSEWDKVFKPFYSTKKQAGGTGMGLTIAQTIIKNHGGSVRIEGREGEGATVTIALPLVYDETAGEEEPSR